MSKGNKVTEEFVYRLKAGYPYFYISTFEMERCVNLLVEAVNEMKGTTVIPYKPVVWDIQGNPDAAGEKEVPEDPEEVLEFIDQQEPGAVVFLKNYNWFLKNEFDKPNVQIITTLQRNYKLYSRSERRKVLVIVSDEPTETGLPTAVMRDFTPLEFELPNEEEIAEVLEAIIKSAKKNSKFKAPNEKVKKRLVDAALGLTLAEVENAYAFALSKKGDLDVRTVDKIKAGVVKNIAGVYYAEYDTTFEQIKGLDNIKTFTLDTINHEDSKGIILLGPAGTCKTTFAQALGNETGKRMLYVEMAEFQGGIVGETERKFREAIAVIKAMAGSNGVIVFIDELEKGLSGVGGPQTVSSDSVTKRGASQWLKFMSDPKCRVYFIATCNDIRAIPPEYLRAERWDTAPFFVDLPVAKEREVILDYYKEYYGIKKGKDNTLPARETSGWSGAELKSVCRIANMRGESLKSTRKFIRPVSATMDVEIKALRSWAMNDSKEWTDNSRCIPASTPVRKVKDKGDDSRYIDFVRRVELK